MFKSLAKSALFYTIKINVCKSGGQQGYLPLRKFLHVCASRNAKFYIDHENMHAHEILETSSKPYQIMDKYNELVPVNNFSQAILQSNAENMSVQEMFDNFKLICCYCQQSNSCISEQQFTEFVREYCDVIHLLSDEQLKDSLRLLRILPVEDSVRSANYIELWNTLDIECCRRIEKWTTDELLLVCDAWYQLNLTRICDFVQLALRKLNRKVIKMQPYQLIQTIFLCNVLRRAIFDMFDFEANLAKCANKMTLSELGVMALGFFKTQTPIRNPALINHLYLRLMQELDTVNDITFVAILKVLRHSSKLPQNDLMMQLCDKIYKEKVESINLLTCLHVSLLGCEIQSCHDELLEKILHKFVKQSDTMRLKDMERISLVMALFNVHTSTKIEDILCEIILKSLPQRIEEIVKHPRCFTSCLHYLSLRGYYDKQMLSSALEEKFLKHTAGNKIAMCREVFHLDTFVKVNLSNEGYEGPQLPDKYRQRMGKLLTNYIPECNSKFKLNATDTILVQIKESIDGFIPHNQLKHILPNYERSDIVICYDRQQRKSLEISKDCPENYMGAILTRDLLLDANNRNEVDTIAIVIAGWNNVIKDKNRYTGSLAMKLKQLEILGHKHVVIIWYEWRALETHKDRVEFLKRRLSEVTKL